jgi:hypothetical protein
VIKSADPRENASTGRVERADRTKRTLLRKLGSKFTVAALLPLMIGGAVIASASAALAGTNGQQVEFANGASTEVKICGTNQYNNHVCGVAPAVQYQYRCLA